MPNVISHINKNRNLAGGGGGGAPIIFTAGTIQADREEVGDGTYLIAPGAYEIRIGNVGFQGQVTVNGKPLSPGGERVIKSKLNWVTKKMDFCPITTIVVSGGAEAWYEVEDPS